MKYPLTILAGSIFFVASMMPAHASTAAKLDDATIFSIFDQANMVDISIGRLGAKQGHTEDVRKLGRMVASEHESVQQMGRDLARKLGIVPTPPDNDTSAENYAKIIAMLQAKSGVEFDKAYLQHEIGFHQSVIDVVKETLLPAVKNEQFRALITKLLPDFEHHLAETKATAKKLGITQ